MSCVWRNRFCCHWQLGLSIEQTALEIGRSSGATCTMRTRFSKVAAGEMSAPRSKRQLRNRANADLERERKILDEVLPDAATAGVVVISRVKPAIEAKLGKTLALSSVYRMLARHGWGQARTLKETLKGVKTGGKNSLAI